MQPFPSPLEPVPAVKTNNDAIHNMTALVSNVIADWQGEVDGDVLAMWDIAGTAITDWERITNKQITDMERKVRRAATTLFGNETDQTGTDTKDVVGTTTQVVRDIETPQAGATISLDAFAPQGPGLPPKACKCAIPVGTDLSHCQGSQGMLVWCDPVTGIFVACRPYDGGPIESPWCLVPPGGILPIPPTPEPPPYPEPPPTPQPPPEKECCPQQVIQVQCPENMNRQRPGPCAPKEECDGDDGIDIKPMDDSKYPPGEECKVDNCYKRDGQVLPDEWTKIPLALNDGDETEHVHSECGQATTWKKFADFFAVRDVVTSNDPKIVALDALGRIGGSFAGDDGYVTESGFINFMNRR